MMLPLRLLLLLMLPLQHLRQLPHRGHLSLEELHLRLQQSRILRRRRIRIRLRRRDAQVERVVDILLRRPRGLQRRRRRQRLLRVRRRLLLLLGRPSGRARLLGLLVLLPGPDARG